MDSNKAICLPYIPSSGAEKDRPRLESSVSGAASQSSAKPAFCEAPPRSNFFLDLLRFIFTHELAVIFYVFLGPPTVFDLIYFLANRPTDAGDAAVIGGVNAAYWVFAFLAGVIIAALTSKGDSPKSNVVLPAPGRLDLYKGTGLASEPPSFLTLPAYNPRSSLPVANGTSGNLKSLR